MSKSITDEEMEQFLENQQIKRHQEEQAHNCIMKIMRVHSAAYDDSFNAFKKAVEECAEDMKTISEEKLHEILILALGSEVSSDEKVHYLLDNYISNVNLEINNSEASMRLLGWALMHNKPELVTRLLAKGADPNAIVYEHQETGVKLTALGVVFNDFWQYHEVQRRGIEAELAKQGIIFSSKINETLLRPLLDSGAQLSQPAITCEGKVALIPAENGEISQLPCVKEALSMASNSAKSGNESSVLNSGSSINNSNILSGNVPGEETKQEMPEVESALGSIENLAYVYPAPSTSTLLIQEKGELDSIAQKFGEFGNNVEMGDILGGKPGNAQGYLDAPEVLGEGFGGMEAPSSDSQLLLKQ